jgi:hypothetical protein
MDTVDLSPLKISSPAAEMLLDVFSEFVARHPAGHASHLDSEQSFRSKSLTLVTMFEKDQSGRFFRSCKKNCRDVLFENMLE